MKIINSSDYVDHAESVIKKLKAKTNPKTGRPVAMVTTSKIRNLLAMTDDIYNEVTNLQEERLSEEIKSRIEYLRVRFIYECGREQTVRDFVEEAGIIEILKSLDGTRKDYILFTRYMESLVAFHKYYGGKDN